MTGALHRLKHLTAGLLFGLAALPASASTVTLTTVGGRSFAGSSGTPLASGCLIRVGTFDLPDATRDAMLSSTRDYQQLRSWFKPLAEGGAGAGTPVQALVAASGLRTNDFPAPGQTFGTVSGISTSYLPPGSRIYLWVFDGPTPESSLQWGIFTAGAWTAPPALGSQALSTNADVHSLQGSADEDALRLAPIPVSYANWVWKNFPGGTQSTQLAITADDDGDGLHNLAEYAWGLNPAMRDKARFSLHRDGEAGARFSFDVPRQRPDVTVMAECSTDLKHWFPAPSIVTAESLEYETRTTSANGLKCFWRIKISQSSP